MRSLLTSRVRISNRELWIWFFKNNVCCEWVSVLERRYGVSRQKSQSRSRGQSSRRRHRSDIVIAVVIAPGGDAGGGRAARLAIISQCTVKRVTNAPQATTLMLSPWLTLTKLEFDKKFARQLPRGYRQREGLTRSAQGPHTIHTWINLILCSKTCYKSTRIFFVIANESELN